MLIDTARVVEIFSSIQGEGPYVGVRQVFVRFVGCNIRCIYCDTPDAFVNPEKCLVETEPGSREFRKQVNPLAADDLDSIIRSFTEVPHHSVSLTGGEPLMHATFLQSFLPKLKDLDVKVYLETNGILSAQFEKVADQVDIVSMDIKLPSTLKPSHDFSDEQRDFLGLASSKEVFVKIVILADTDDAEVLRAAGLVESVRPDIPVILQPVTPDGTLTQAPSPGQILHLHASVSRILKDVRVIPQTHKLSGLL